MQASYITPDTLSLSTTVQLRRFLDSSSAKRRPHQWGKMLYVNRESRYPRHAPASQSTISHYNAITTSRMARFGSERFPEQYPAVLDEWADPVESDNAEMASIRPLLKNTNLESRSLRLVYDANRDGWDATSFHSKVDRQSGGVVLCTTRSGIKCGGCE